MKTNEYRETVYLLNQYLNQCYQNALDSLSFLFSVYLTFKGKDELDEEERMNEDTEDTVFEAQSIITPLVRGLRSHSSTLQELAFSTGILPKNLVDDIEIILALKEEGNSISTSSLSPYFEEKDDQRDALDEGIYRLIVAHRVRAWIKDIADGILNYGVAPYEIPADDDEHAVNILDGLEEMSVVDMIKEIPSYLNPDDDDNDDLTKDKEYEAYLLKRILPLYKKEK